MEDKLVGDTSSSEDWYHVIDFDDIHTATLDAISRYPEIGVNGEVSLSDTMHKMSSKYNFEGGETTVYADENGEDAINLGLKIQSGHTGHNALKLDVGAERLVCSNGMTAFVSDFHREQTHQKPLQTGLIESGVDAVLEGVDKVENRIEDAKDRYLNNKHEALYVMTNFDLDQFVDVDDLQECLEEEMEIADYGEDRDEVDLHTAYQAATRALTHRTGDIPQHRLDEGFEKAAGILDYGNGIPHPDILGENAVENRVNEYLDDPDSDEYWEGEQDDLRELMQVHGVQV